jgi:hypothetical protein
MAATVQDSSVSPASSPPDAQAELFPRQAAARPQRHTDPLRMWAKKLIEKKPFKMARIAFAILRGKAVYRELRDKKRR